MCPVGGELRGGGGGARDTLGRFSALIYNGDNFCDFLFASLHSGPFLKRGLPEKEIICSQVVQNLPYLSHLTPFL